MKSVKLRFKPYLEVIELLLQYADRKIFEDNYKYRDAKSSKEICLRKNSATDEFSFEREGVYKLKVSILPKNMIEIDVLDYSCSEEEIDKLMDYFNNNGKINFSISSIRVEEKEKSRPYKEEIFTKTVKEFISKYSISEGDIEYPEPSDEKVASRVKIKIRGIKFFLTQYKNGTITTQGENSGYHEEFWKIYIEFLKKGKNYEKENN